MLVTPLSMAVPVSADVLTGSDLPLLDIGAVPFVPPSEVLPYFDDQHLILFYVDVIDSSTYNINCIVVPVNATFTVGDYFGHAALMPTPDDVGATDFWTRIVVDGSPDYIFPNWEETHFFYQLPDLLVYWSSTRVLTSSEVIGFNNGPFEFYRSTVSYVPAGDGVLSVFSGVGSWLSGAVQNISTMFWTSESGMTVLGYLAVASLAVAVILLIFYLIAGWLKFH